MARELRATFCRIKFFVMRTEWLPSGLRPRNMGHITGPLALPAELRAQIGAFYSEKVAKFGFLDIQFLGKIPTNQTEKRGAEIRVGCISLWMRTERSPS